MLKKKFYITTSIAYTNAAPHLGFALELVQADVLARYHRLLKEDVFFLTGTDEHGLKIERKAKEANKSPLQFTTELAEKFKELTRVLNISNNDFIRTTDQQKHWPTVEKVWQQLVAKADIYKKQYQGFYCLGCEAFVKEKDLINGRCPYHQKKPELVSEENYFFRLSKYVPKVKKEIEKDKIKIIPITRKNEILSFLNQEEIEDISVSRAKSKCGWGIPVPNDPEQVIYVWFEALLNYLFPKEYWPADVQCLGKDILRFHAVIWPAILLAVGLPRPKTIFVHGFITAGGQKMAKSLGNVVDPFALVKNYGADAVRYFLLREIPASEDGDFTIEKFEKRYNADLAKGLGNLVARVITLAKISNFKFLISKPQSRTSSLRGRQIPNPKFQKLINETSKKYKTALEKFKFNEALIAIWDLISFCDKYIERQQPWRLLPSNPKSEIRNPKLRETLFNLLFALDNIAQMLQSFLPQTSEKILKQIKTKKSEILFPRI
ncbi:MAG: methionine--tRNA ligase [Minisyncoccales bacterium]